MKKILLAILFVSLVVLSGCVSTTEKYPHQDKIDLVSKHILISSACKVESNGYCLKYKEIEMSNWKVMDVKSILPEYGEGYIVTADSFDEGRPRGMKIGEPIWYIKNNEVYWVNGKAKSISYGKEAPQDIQQDILKLRRSDAL